MALQHFLHAFAGTLPQALLPALRPALEVIAVEQVRQPTLSEMPDGMLAGKVVALRTELGDQLQG